MDQLAMDFSKPAPPVFTHEIENNAESEANYITNLEHFNNQCRTVLEQLLTGRRLTVRGALIHMNIGHLPRRIKDLKDAGIMVMDEFPVDPVTGKKKTHKEYYLEDNFIQQYLCRQSQGK